MKHWIDKSFNWVVAQFDKISLPEQKDEDFGRQGAIGFLVICGISIISYIIYSNSLSICFSILGKILYGATIVIVIFIAVFCITLVLMYVSTFIGRYVVLGWNKMISLFSKKSG